MVEHNWLKGGPYIGISLGWGWASHPDSTAGNNLIRYNRIEDFMAHTFDGSGVYALAITNQPNFEHNGGADKQDIFEDNRIVTDGNWPAEATEIKAKAGLEPAFADLAQ